MRGVCINLFCKELSGEYWKWETERGERERGQWLFLRLSELSFCVSGFPQKNPITLVIDITHSVWGVDGERHRNKSGDFSRFTSFQGLAMWTEESRREQWADKIHKGQNVPSLKAMLKVRNGSSWPQLKILCLLCKGELFLNYLMFLWAAEEEGKEPVTREWWTQKHFPHNFQLLCKSSLAWRRKASSW